MRNRGGADQGLPETPKKLRTQNGIVTLEALTEAGVEQLPLDHRARVRLATALHQRRRCLARWHATAGVVDRSDGSGDPRLRSVLA